MKQFRIFIFFTLIGFKIQLLEAQTIGLNIGDQAPDLNYWNKDSTAQISLSSLRGKIVLLDFWASWCGGCRIDNPYIVKTYNKYKNMQFGSVNGFEVYSVSLDYTRANWVTAINHDSLYWQSNVSDLKGWNSQAAATYSINAIPANFLLNENGIIIGENYVYSNGDLDTTLNNLSNNVGINGYQNKNYMSLYPNPVISNFTITAISPLETITIYNSVGQLIMQQNTKANNIQIDLSQQPIGIYFLKVQNQNIKIIKN